MKKDLLSIFLIVLVFLGAYYLLSVEDPRKLQHVILSLIPAIPVYYLLVKRNKGESAPNNSGVARKFTEKTARD